MYINTQILGTLLGVLLVGLMSLIAWIVKQINELSRFVAAMKVTEIDHGDRLKRLEQSHWGRYQESTLPDVDST